MKMKFVYTRLKKPVIIVVSAIAIMVIVIVFSISSITKYLIEKYDEKYAGRQITLDRVYLNPFTGYVHISNLKIYESKNRPHYKDSNIIFFSAKSVSANFSMLKLF